MFHYRNSWYFEKQEKGFVKIRKEIAKDVVAEVLINPDSWCSIIASMSAEGNSTKKWDEAYQFHGGSSSPPTQAQDASVRGE